MGIRTPVLAFVAVLPLAPCGGSKTNRSVCDQSPPPAARSLSCHPSPIAGHTVPPRFYFSSRGPLTPHPAAGGAPCPPNANFDGFPVPRALNNASAIDPLIAGNAPNNGSTPTADWITQCKNDFATPPPPAGGSPIILLATDGEPNACGNGNDNGAAVAATQSAYMAGIRTFIVGLQPAGGTPLNPDFL